MFQKPPAHDPVRRYERAACEAGTPPGGDGTRSTVSRRELCLPSSPCVRMGPLGPRNGTPNRLYLPGRLLYLPEAVCNAQAPHPAGRMGPDRLCPGGALSPVCEAGTRAPSDRRHPGGAYTSPPARV
jgi:hypothetical protein